MYLRLLIFLPNNLDSSLWVIQPSISHDVLCIEHGDNIQPWCTPFPIFNQSIVSCPVLFLLDLHSDFSEGRSGGLVLSSLEEFSTVCCDPHSQRLGIVNKAEVEDFLELFCFFNDPMDDGNLIFGSSPFLNATWTSGSSWFTYCWSLAWRILSITLLVCKMSAIVW